MYTADRRTMMNSITPRLQTSYAVPWYGIPWSTSGAAYAALPQ